MSVRNSNDSHSELDKLLVIIAVLAAGIVAGVIIQKQYANKAISQPPNCEQVVRQLLAGEELSYNQAQEVTGPQFEDQIPYVAEKLGMDKTQLYRLRSLLLVRIDPNKLDQIRADSAVAR